jgi:hypothetical protein
MGKSVLFEKVPVGFRRQGPGAKKMTDGSSGGWFGGDVFAPVCTENSIRVDDVTESPKLAA